LGTRPAILIDTNIIIEAVRVGAFKRLRAHETLVTVRRCCEEALSGVPGSPGRVPIQDTDLAEPLVVVDVTHTERAQLFVSCDAACALDDGERDLLSHALTRHASGEAIRIICADQAAVRVAIELGLGDKLVSLEEVLTAAGVKPDGDLKRHYTTPILSEWKTLHALGM
jgi:hypothetical protein